jgi:acetylornithine/succinyldiaminopimelate/putrescine aminotransferase/predicted amino acid dehydrogenase
MTVEVLLDRLRAKGIDLSAADGKLRVSAPRGALTEELRNEVANRRDELLAALAGGNGASKGAFTLPKAVEEGPGSASHAELYRRRFRSRDERSVLIDAAPPYVRFVNPCQGYMYQMINLDKKYVRGQGCELFDEQGARYLDFIAAYGALPFGHNPAGVWDAIEQMRREQTPNFIQPSILDGAGRLAERLIALAPKGMRYATFANSGAEAVEAAIKLCRSASRRPGMLSTLNSFHGKTLGALSATGKRIYQAAFAAPAQGFHYVPFGDAAALEEAFAARPDFYAGFIVEPIQGEGGIVEPPDGYLAKAAQICRRHGMLFVVDEVQTGLGRTGAMFACEHAAVTPDVMALAKALGGGIMPIGAVLCTEAVYNEEFATQHTSTFAGNNLACRAGLATLDLLERDDRALIRHAAEIGGYLRAGLEKLAEAHPLVVKAARGRGLLLGLQFNLESDLFARGFSRYLCDQAIFTYVLAAYLLNVHRIRVAPTLSAPDVIRIEPPLIVSKPECDELLRALEECAQIIEAGSVARFVAHLIEVDLSGRPLASSHSVGRHRAISPKRPRPAEAGEGRFGFVTHLGDEDTWTQLDPGLGVFTEDEMARLKDRVVDLLDPVPIGEVVVESPDGRRARGEFVMLPFAAREVIKMPYERAVAEVRYAVELCAQRGAKIVGLGGFNSVVTQGGLALAETGSVALTTGNSYTALAGVQALDAACVERGIEPARCAAAVIGASGAVGKAIATLLAERVGSLHLVGNPAHPDRSLKRLTDIAASILQHLWREQARGKSFPDGSLAGRLLSRRLTLPADPQPEHFRLLAQDFIQRDRCILITTHTPEAITGADLVATATSSVDKLANSHSFKKDAIVCELSRPFNFSEDVKRARPDVLFIEGGLVCLPGGQDLGLNNGLPEGVAFACVIETILLALEHNYAHTSLGVDLEPTFIERIGALAQKHGFTVTR